MFFWDTFLSFHRIFKGIRPFPTNFVSILNIEYYILMKKMKCFPILFFTIVLLSLNGCKKDDVDNVVLQETSYPLISLNASGVTGTATFTENSDGTTYILIELVGSNTSEHPAYIRYNNYVEGGANAITLKDCTCLVSETVVTKLDGGTNINYDGLLKFNGHVAILASKTDDTVVAVADIGTNAN